MHEPRNQRLPREDRIRDIIMAARGLFCERGFADSSISEIATRAGIAQGTIYKFFESKRDIVVAVLEQWYGSITGRILEELPGIQGAENKLRYFIWRHLTFMHGSPEMFRLCANEFRNDGDSYRPQILSLNRRYTEIMVDIVKEGIASGEFASDIQTELVRDLVFGGTDNALTGFVYRGYPLDPATVAEQIARVVIRGIRAEPGPASADTVLSDLTRRVEEIAARVETLAKPR